MVDVSNPVGIVTSGFPPLTYRTYWEEPHLRLHWVESYARTSCPPIMSKRDW